MNLALESPPETVEAEVEETVMVPEVMTDEEVQKIKGPDALLKQLESCKTRFSTLKPVDTLTAKQCAALIETCTFASRYAESRRTEITEPLNKLVKDANEIWQPIVKGFAEVAKTRGAEVSKWIADQKALAAIAQQKLIDDAKAKQDEIDRKEKEAREEAERVRLAAASAKTIDEAEALHQQADKLEKKADVLAIKSENIVTQVVPVQAKTIDLGSSTFSAKAPKKTYMLAGWDKQKPLRVTDPKLSALVGDLSKLPAGVQFILQHADLNPVHLNKSYGVIPFPSPFADVDDFSGSSVRVK